MLKLFKLFIILALLGPCLLPVTARADIMEEVNGPLTNYYRNPDPAKIPGFLEKVAPSDFIKNSETEVISMVAYLFARIAQLEPSLVPEYIKIFEQPSQTHEARVFILMILQVCGDEKTAGYLKSKLSDKDFQNERKDIEYALAGPIPVGFNALKNEIKRGVDLDYLWAEFFATGNSVAITQIISVLSWKDVVREKLQNWLYNKHSKAEVRKLERLLVQEMGVEIDFENSLILSRDDLDCIYSNFANNSGGPGQVSKSAVEIRKILGISDEELMPVVVKGAAMWSLIMNSEQHDKVYQICQSELELLGDKAPFQLAMIVEIVRQTLGGSSGT